MLLKNKIENLFENGPSATQIAHGSGLKEPTIYKYQTGKLSLDNMTLKNATKLEKYINKIHKYYRRNLND